VPDELVVHTLKTCATNSSARSAEADASSRSCRPETFEPLRGERGRKAVAAQGVEQFLHALSFFADAQKIGRACPRPARGDVRFQFGERDFSSLRYFSEGLVGFHDRFDEWLRAAGASTGPTAENLSRVEQAVNLAHPAPRRSGTLNRRSSCERC